MPPEDTDARRGAVLILFADVDGDGRGEVLLTERAHHMRSHPGQVSFPGGSIDAGETAVEAACARPRRRSGSTRPRSRSSASCPSCGCRRPTSRSRRSSATGATAARSSVVSPDEVHAIHHVTIDHLVDPANRINVRHPSGWLGPGFLIGPDRDVILWGFTAGIIARLFDFVGWSREWDTDQVRDLPDYMLHGDPTPTVADAAEHTLRGVARVNILDWCLVALVGIYALSGYWQGFVTGAFATAGLLLRRPVRGLGRADRAG